MSHIYDLPDEILISINYILDLKSWLSFSTSSKTLYDVYVKKLLLILRDKIKKLTRFNTSNYELQYLINVYKLRVTDISIGGDSSLILNSKGQVYSLNISLDIMIYDDVGDYELVDPTFDLLMYPNIEKIIKVETNFLYSYILSRDGKLYSIKSHASSLLEDIGDPILISNIPKITKIALVPSKLLFISDDKYVYQRNSYHTNSHFEILPNVNNAVDVGMGIPFLFILTSDNNLHYLLNDSHNMVPLNYKVLRMLVSMSGIVILTEENVVMWATNDFKGTLEVIHELSHVSTIVDISYWEVIIAVLNDDGKVWIYDLETKLSKLLPLSNIIKISTNDLYLLATDYNGYVYYYDLDDSHSEVMDENVPIQIPNLNLL